jgi:hypothetical protein
MNRKHIVVSPEAFDLIRADSKKSGKPMFQIAGDIISFHYLGNSDVNTELAEGKILTENINTMPSSKNSEIGSKTPFSAKKNVFLNGCCEPNWGYGGNYINTNTVTSSLDGVTSIENSLKEKNIKKRKGKSADCISNFSDDFEKFCKIYPNQNYKARAYKTWERYRKRGTLPDLDYLIAAVELFKKKNKYWQENWKGETYIPSLSRWIRNCRWVELRDDDIHKKIAEMKNAEARKEQTNTQLYEQKQPQKKFCIPADVKLPATVKLWDSMPIGERLKIGERCNAGLCMGNIRDEIMRRENSQTQEGV